MAHPAVGIDLGTTYSALAVINPAGRPEIVANAEGERITASAVFFQKNGSVLVGQDAADSAGGFPDRVVRCWDRGYRQRASACGVFLVTEPMLIDLHDPVPILTEDLGIFGGRMPGTQNPPRIDPAVVDQLLDLAARRRDNRAA